MSRPTGYHNHNSNRIFKFKSANIFILRLDSNPQTDFSYKDLSTVLFITLHLPRFVDAMTTQAQKMCKTFSGASSKIIFIIMIIIYFHFSTVHSYCRPHIWITWPHTGVWNNLFNLQVGKFDKRLSTSRSMSQPQPPPIAKSFWKTLVIYI